MRGGSGRISSLDKANRSYVTIYVSAPLFCKKMGAPVYLLISYLILAKEYFDLVKLRQFLVKFRLRRQKDIFRFNIFYS